MARRVLVIGAIAWVLAGLAGIGLAVGWTDDLISLLPPLAIDRDALGGAITAVALGALGVGMAHVVVILGLARRRRWAGSAGALLASILAFACLALGSAAVASAVRDAGRALPLLAGALLAAVAAAGYGLAAVRLAIELRAGSAS